MRFFSCLFYLPSSCCAVIVAVATSPSLQSLSHVRVPSGSTSYVPSDLSLYSLYLRRFFSHLFNRSLLLSGVAQQQGNVNAIIVVVVVVQITLSSFHYLQNGVCTLSVIYSRSVRRGVLFSAA